MSDTSFPVEEFQSRVRRIRERMRANKIDALILDETEAMVWVSGYAVGETLWRCCVIPPEGEPFLLIRSLDAAPGRSRSWVPEIITFKDWEDPVSLLSAELQRRGIDRKRIGIDYHSPAMFVARFDHLRRLLPNAELVDFGRVITEMRWRKSPAEIAYFRKAAAITEAAMRAALQAIKVGGTQREIAAAVAAEYYNCGADGGSVGPLTAGLDWDSLHSYMGVGPLERGSIVHFEFVPRVRDYSSRLMRSVVVGKATPKQLDVTSRMIELQDRQLAALRPGVKASDIDRMLREPMIESGLRPNYENVTGYMLGAFPPSSPRGSDFTRAFLPGVEWVVEEGMTLHMYTSAQGLAVSETMLITDRGAERLTKTERKLFEAAV